MEPSWKDSIFRQREELARMLREPIALLANKCAPVWGDRERLNAVLTEGFPSIPYCTYLYAAGNDATQISDGSHYMRYVEFLAKGATFWTGTAE